MGCVKTWHGILEVGQQGDYARHQRAADDPSCSAELVLRGESKGSHSMTGRKLA